MDRWKKKQEIECQYGNENFHTIRRGADEQRLIASRSRLSAG